MPFWSGNNILFLIEPSPPFSLLWPFIRIVAGKGDGNIWYYEYKCDNLYMLVRRGGALGSERGQTPRLRAVASPGKHGHFTLIVDISFELDILDYCHVDMSLAYFSRP
jgi:hypothetical protein